MSLRVLPAAQTFTRPQNFESDVPSDVMSKWAANPLAAQSDNPDTVTIFDVIGEDFWTGGGFTAKRMGAALRAIGPKPVTVQINSPGGDMFEGIAIYNQLREHPAQVTIEVMGWAASAASIIAMAGDTIRMGLGTFMMVHNAWGMVVGNRHDMREAATVFEGFDSAIADIYEARTGGKRKDIVAMMDAETFMGPTDAIKAGFADEIIDTPSPDSGQAKTMDRGLMARRQTEAALAKAGFSRSARAEMLGELIGSGAAKRDAGRAHAERDAGLHEQIKQFIEDIKSGVKP